MELTVFDIIKRPLVTSKAIQLYRMHGQITFEVNRDATKAVIAHAIEKIWNVKVDAIRVMNVKGKTKVFARKPYQRPDWKKAIVTLMPGHKINIPGLFDVIDAQLAARNAHVETEGA